MGTAVMFLESIPTAINIMGNFPWSLEAMTALPAVLWDSSSWGVGFCMGPQLCVTDSHLCLVSGIVKNSTVYMGYVIIRGGMHGHELIAVITDQLFYPKINSMLNSYSTNSNLTAVCIITLLSINFCLLHNSAFLINIQRSLFSCLH